MRKKYLTNHLLHNKLCTWYIGISNITKIILLLLFIYTKWLLFRIITLLSWYNAVRAPRKGPRLVFDVFDGSRFPKLYTST